MKTRELKEAYGKVPESFHNSVVRTLNELDSAEFSNENDYKFHAFDDNENMNVIAVQTKKTGLIRRAAAFALILTIGVFSLKAVYPMVMKKSGMPGSGLNSETSAAGQLTSASTSDQPQKEESQSENSESEGAATQVKELNLVLPQSENAPEYAKMTIGYLPEGVIEDQGKYSLNGNHEEMCFTIVGSRVIGVKHFSDLNILNADEMKVNGNTVIIANVAGEPFSRRFYIFFEEMATFVTGYVTSDVPDEELEEVISNITVEECTANESNLPSLTQEEINEEREAAFYAESEEDYGDINFYEVKLGQKVSIYANVDYSHINFTVDKIDVLDNISHLDYNNFGCAWMDINEMVDENGNFLPYERNYYHYGDGKTEAFESVVKTDTADRCLVYASVTFNNENDVPVEYCLANFGIVRCKFENGSISGEYSNDDGVPELTDGGEVNYIEKDTSDEDYYYVTIPAHGSTTVRLGFIEDKDQVTNLCLFMYESDGDKHINYDPNLSAYIDGSENSFDSSFGCIKIK